MANDKCMPRFRSRSPWRASLLTLLTAVAGIGLLAAILNSATSRQLDPKGCRMSYMSPSYRQFHEFDTEHTRFASKYSLYLYRESGIDDETKIRGIPVLFIPGNAGSYKQVRPIAAETANYFHQAVQRNPELLKAGLRNLDIFTVDFNEDFTAFHGQALLDQAEYLNEAIRFILSLYLDPRLAQRDAGLPDPTSVIIIGHSMGGVVARAMLTMPNYQEKSINTILTMSAPHARAPVSFDSSIVKTYNEINTHWRRSHSEKWANNNPLWHVTLVSVAGGGLDTVVPSDYASVESIVPATHGFTVFTSTIPYVWTSMDHLAILWCDQFRKTVAKALYDVVDVTRSCQTKPRAARMAAFKKHFLTGLEDITDGSSLSQAPTVSLSLSELPARFYPPGERLVIRHLGGTGQQAQMHLMPVPHQDVTGAKRFTLLTEVPLADRMHSNSMLDVLACNTVPEQLKHTRSMDSLKFSVADDGEATSHLACRKISGEAIALPASTPSTRYPFYRDDEDVIVPFSYLQFNLADLASYQYMAVLDKAKQASLGFVIAEFSDHSMSTIVQNVSMRQLLATGVSFRLPAYRPMVSEIKIPSIKYSLLTYRLRIGKHACGKKSELFRPLLRQHHAEPYESKYYVDAKDVSISLHGVAPYVPPPIAPRRAGDGISLQFWTDPTCGTDIDVKVSVDFYGSLGKLNMRYRTILLAFPLVVVTLVIHSQFRVYDTTGDFPTFFDGLNLSLRRSIPLVIFLLTSLSLLLGRASPPTAPPPSSTQGSVSYQANSTVDFLANDLIVGTKDPFLWFITPMVVIVCVGLCVAMNYVVLALTQAISSAYGWVRNRPAWMRCEDRRPSPLPPCHFISLRRRILSIVIVVMMVSTVVPYQLAYALICIVQLVTTIRAHRAATDTRSPACYNLYNYVHSMLLLMLWILPVNLPLLVVWVRDAVVNRWITPQSPHTNLLAVMPFALLVENVMFGRMVPSLGPSRLRHVTTMLLVGGAVYTGIYGATYAYVLHRLVSCIALWLVLVYAAAEGPVFPGFDRVAVSVGMASPGARKEGKDP